MPFLPRVKDFLRSLVTGNGSEVVLPWFPEHDTRSPEMRLIRKSRIEPEPAVWQYPLAFILWTGWSLYLSIRTTIQEGKKVRQICGLSRFRQFLQMLFLAWFRNISPLNYLQCWFFKPEHREQAEHFVPPFRLGRLTKQLNEGCPTERLDHKLLGYQTLMAAGLPTVEILEIFHADGRREFSRTDEDLSRYLGQDLFVKPVNMFTGLNTNRWIHDAESGTYSDGERTVPTRELWSLLTREAAELGREQPEKQARLVQPLVRNHPDIEPLSRYSLNTFRINTLCFPDGRVAIHDVCFKMGYGDAVDDTSSVVAAFVDMETGYLMTGWNSQYYPGQDLETHPTTGARILGTPVPCWKELMDLALRAQKTFPENPIIGWDIAVTPEGPLIIEANCNPNFAVVQTRLSRPLTKSVFLDLYWSWKK